MKHHIPLSLFLLSFIVFNLNLRPVASCDSIPTSLLPFSIILDHSLALDRYFPYYLEHFPNGAYFFTITRERVYSAYPITTSLLITPFYVPVVSLLQMHDWPVERIVPVARAMEKVMASFIASLSVVALYALIKRLTRPGTAVLCCIFFAFGTEMWSTSSQALWQHGPGVLMIICSLLYLDDTQPVANRSSRILLAGLFAALSMAIRPTNVLLVLASGSYLLVWKRNYRQLLLYSIFPLITGIALGCYNHHFFGSFRGNEAYQECLVPPSLETLVHLAGLLMSPGRGLFTYTPALLASVIGVLMRWRHAGSDCSPVYAISLLFAAFQIMLISCTKDSYWVGGGCYGPRYLTEITPGLILFLIPARTSFMRIPLLKGAIAVAVLFSISTQAVGAFCYPNGDWEVDPVLFSAQPGRLWDWKDNPILRAARAGIVRSPYRQLQRVCLPRASLYTVWDCGFCGRERTENYDWRWGASEGRLVIINVSRKERMATLELGCRTGYPQFSRIKIESPWFSRELLVSSVKEGRLSETIVIPPGNSFVSFTCDAPRVNNSADPRVLVFRVMNASLKEIDQDAGLR